MSLLTFKSPRGNYNVRKGVFDATVFNVRRIIGQWYITSILMRTFSYFLCTGARSTWPMAAQEKRMAQIVRVAPGPMREGPEGAMAQRTCRLLPSLRVCFLCDKDSRRLRPVLIWKGEEEVRRDESGIREIGRQKGGDSGVSGLERQRGVWGRRPVLEMGRE